VFSINFDDVGDTHVRVPHRSAASTSTLENVDIIGSGPGGTEFDFIPGNG
jgi:hypothetical protein